jgi:hypothetical protein
MPIRDAEEIGRGQSILTAAVPDLAAMTLTPTDLEAEGLDGYGVGFGQAMFLDDVITSTTQARGLPESEVRQFYEDAGFVRRYDTFLYLPADESDPAGEAARLVVSYVLEFADETGAAGAWAFLEDESASETAEDVRGVETVGDQSEATRDRGADAATGAEYAEIDFTFRVGNLHAGVAIVDWQGEDPDVAEAETLANRLRDRIEATLDDGAPGLGSRVSRLTGSDVVPSADYYLIRDGEAIVLYGESTEQATARSDAAAEIGQTDGYRLWQQIAAGKDGADDDVWYLIELDRFADEDAAAEWLAGTEERVEANTALANLEVDRDAPTFGDESFAYTVETSDGTYRYRSVTLRVGKTIALVDVGAPETPPAEAIAMSVKAQAACLESGGCAQPLALPETLKDFLAGLGESGREGDVTPTGDIVGTKSETYTSPTYGYTLTYDPDIWTVVNESVGSYDYFMLQSQAATFVLSGTNVYDDLAGCLAGAIAGFQVGEGTPAEGIAGPTPAAGAEAALMAYDVTTTEGKVATVAAYFECRWVVEGKSTLSITLMAADDTFPAVLPLYEDLIAGLTVPAAENGNQATGGQMYVNPTWGYSVTWDPADWVPTDKERDDGIEFHIMGDVLVIAVIAATEDYGGDPAACLAGVVEAVQGDQPLVPADDLPAPATVAEAVGGLYKLGDFAYIYYECRPLIPGEAVLQVRVGAPAYAYEGALPAVEKLLAGITVP